MSSGDGHPVSVPRPWRRHPVVRWAGATAAAVGLAIPGVVLYARDPGVGTLQLNHLLLAPLLALVLYGAHVVLPERAQWAAAIAIVPFGPVAYLMWPDEQWWNYGTLTVLPLMALAMLRDQRGAASEPYPPAWNDGPWGPP